MATNALTPLGSALKARFAEWIRRRQGWDELPVRLERRRLYILPTRAGAVYGVLMVPMLLAGLNYANSLALFLAFLLIAFALVVMQQCHRNLLGTEVLGMVAPAVFAQRPGMLCVTLANRGAAPRLRLTATLPDGSTASADLPAGGQRRLELPLPAAPRGIVRLERLRIATTHPFGLFRAWTWVHAPLELLVYPQPRGTLPMPAQAGSHSGTRALPAAGADEWMGLRPFRDGDSPRQVDWKVYAREGSLLVKEYVRASAELKVFEFASLAQLPLEARLSQLARWVVDAETQGACYGLALPQQWLPPGRGPEHRHRCLAALAVFGLEGG
jgi:uncharacterized protein (DUF58 family)